jgi:hypothetical protein
LLAKQVSGRSTPLTLEDAEQTPAEIIEGSRRNETNEEGEQNEGTK